MPTHSFPIRRLRPVGSPVRGRSYSQGGVFGAAESAVGAVHEVSTDELSLSHEEVIQSLSDRSLRSTDLIWVGGGWTTIAESAPFGEIAEPYARRERRVRNARDAFVFLGLIALYFAIKFSFFLFI